MTSNAADLLRILGGNGGASRVRPSTQAQPQSLEELTRTGSFADLLSAARKGEMPGGPQVSVARDAGVQFTPEQLQRLTVAADMAQAAGATRALVRIDGQSVLLDVGARTITAKVNAAPGQVVTGIDSLIEVPGGAGQPVVQAISDAAAASLKTGPLAGVSKSVADALAAAN